MNLLKKRWKIPIVWIGGGLILAFIVGFVSNRYEKQACQKILVSIDKDLQQYYFINEKDIIALMNNNDQETLLNTRYSNINTQLLEQRVKAHSFVEKCEVSKDIRGNLIVEVRQRQPLARFIGENHDFFVDAHGISFPVSKRYTPYCPVVTTDQPQEVFDFNLNPQDKSLLELLKRIHTDPLWKAQVAQLHKNKKGDWTLHMQVGRPKIEFGQLTDIEIKMAKMRAVYKQILPKKGWDRYQRVSLKYYRQIVCQ